MGSMIDDLNEQELAILLANRNRPLASTMPEDLGPFEVPSPAAALSPEEAAAAAQDPLAALADNTELMENVNLMGGQGAATASRENPLAVLLQNPDFHLLDDLSSQREGITNLQNQLDQLKSMPRGTDFSPLSALVDSWTGSNFTAVTPKAEKPEERIRKIATIEDVLQKRRGELTGTEGALARAAAKGGMDTLNEGREKRFQQNFSYKAEKDIQDDITKNVEMPINTRSEQFGIIDHALASGDYQTVWATLAQFARGVSGEKGVLTDEDIKRIMPRNVYGDVGRIKSYFSETPNEKIGPEWTKALQELAVAARQNAGRVYGGLLSDKRKMYSARNSTKGLMVPKGSGDEMFRVVEDRVKTFGGPPSAPAAGSPPVAASPETSAPAASPPAKQSVTEYLRSRRAGG